MIRHVTPLSDGSEVLLGDNGIYFLPPRHVVTRLRLGLEEPVLPADSRVCSFAHDSIVIENFAWVERASPGARAAVEALLVQRTGMTIVLDFETRSIQEWRNT